MSEHGVSKPTLALLLLLLSQAQASCNLKPRDGLPTSGFQGSLNFTSGGIDGCYVKNKAICNSMATALRMYQQDRGLRYYTPLLEPIGDTCELPVGSTATPSTTGACEDYSDFGCGESCVALHGLMMKVRDLNVINTLDLIIVIIGFGIFAVQSCGTAGSICKGSAFMGSGDDGESSVCSYCSFLMPLLVICMTIADFVLQYIVYEWSLKAFETVRPLKEAGCTHKLFGEPHHESLTKLTDGLETVAILGIIELCIAGVGFCAVLMEALFEYGLVDSGEDTSSRGNVWARTLFLIIIFVEEALDLALCIEDYRLTGGALEEMDSLYSAPLLNFSNTNGYTNYEPEWCMKLTEPSNICVGSYVGNHTSINEDMLSASPPAHASHFLCLIFTVCFLSTFLLL